MKYLILAKKVRSKSLCKKEFWNARAQMTKIILLNSNFSKFFFNKLKKKFNKFNNQFNSQFFNQREIDVNNQREIRDNIKRKRERDEIARLKNIICYDCNEKNYYKFDCFYQQKIIINVVKIEKSKKKKK